MPIGSVPNAATTTSDVPVNWAFKPAGTYDLVALDPTGGKRPARKIVAMAADTWTLEDNAGNSNAAITVFQGFSHVADTRGITCGAAIAVYW